MSRRSQRRSRPGRRFIYLSLVLAGAMISALVSWAAPTAPAVAPAAARWPSAGMSAQPTDNAVLRWNAAALQAVRATRPGPPMVARALAIVHTAVYDAWAAYDPVAVGTRLGDRLRRPAAEHTPANRQRAISQAAYRALVDLFPTRRNDFAAVLRDLGYPAGDASTDPATPAGVGNLAAAAVLAFRHQDGANQLGDLAPGAYADYTGYRPVNTPEVVVDPNRWQPLRVPDGRGRLSVPPFIAPHWGRVTPFALAAPDQFRPPPPARYPDRRYYQQAAELVRISAQLADREKMIAEYWADGPGSELPPGHWNLFAQSVSRRDGHTLDQDVQLFFALNNALLDAGIAVWEAKRHYDYVRPITAIRFLFRGESIEAWGGPHRGLRRMDGADWQPYQPLTFVTPPFAEYVSGHSAFSAAGAEVLRRFTGGDAFGASVTLPAGSSRIEPGAVPAAPLTFSWPTFSAAADEAGLSRRYGGIHFEDGDLQGRALGRRVGALVWEKARGYVNGTAVP